MLIGYQIGLLLLSISLSHQQQSTDNNVDDEPVVSCLANQMNVSFKTKKPFKGHVFVRGHYDTPECHKDFSTNQASGGVLEVSYDHCDIRRKREANPRGMMMSTVVVVSFHRQFITKLDKAYRIDCFYLEHDHEVTQEMHVSSLATTEMPEHSPPMPTCRYEVLNSPDGLPVTFARIGDRVFHKWSCDYPMDDMYCMTVHSCSVDSGDSGKFHQLINEEGCANDRYILEDLRYVTDLHAGAESNVFKMADKAHVYFTCQIRLSLKHDHDDNQCPRPECSKPKLNNGTVVLKRLRRSEPRKKPIGTNVDVVAKPVLVLDIDDPMPDKDLMKRKFNQDTGMSNGFLAYQLLDHPGVNDDYTPSVCLSSISFGILIGVSVLCCMVAFMFILVFILRSKIFSRF